MSSNRYLLHSIKSQDNDHEAFIKQQFIRFGDVDPAGIAYFPNINNLIHEAFEDLWDEYIGINYYQLVQTQRLGFPLAHSNITFLNPLHHGDRPTVSITCSRLGRSSLELRYVYEVDSKICLDARMTTVCINLDTKKSCELPAQYRKAFERIFVTPPEPD